MTTSELAVIINKMTDEERLALGEYAKILMGRRNKKKVHTKAELLGRVEKTNDLLVKGTELKPAGVFLAEICEEYAI